MLPHLLFQDLDLGIQGGDHRDQGPGGSGVGGGQRGRLPEVLAGQRGQDRIGLARDVLAAGALERRADLGAVSFAARAGSGALPSSSSTSGPVRLSRTRPAISSWPDGSWFPVPTCTSRR
jgi:hypothetical protein